jgi:hypothetical protein
MKFLIFKFDTIPFHVVNTQRVGIPESEWGRGCYPVVPQSGCRRVQYMLLCIVPGTSYPKGTTSGGRTPGAGIHV